MWRACGAWARLVARFSQGRCRAYGVAGGGGGDGEVGERESRGTALGWMRVTMARNNGGGCRVGPHQVMLS